MNEEKETKLEKLEKSAEQLKVEFYQDQFGNTVAEIGKRTYDIEDPVYKALLAEKYYEEYKDVFNESTYNKHISLGISKAVRKNPKYYPRRVHRIGNTIYYDTGLEVWEFKAGVYYVYLAEDPDCPVIFRRYKDFKNAPIEPTDKKASNIIKEIISQYNHDGIHWAYIASFFEPNHSHPIGLFNGEPGSAKSTLTTFIKELVDPSTVEKIDLPEKAQDFDTYREKFYVCNYDNVRKISAAHADDLCRQVTGSSSVKRKLYTNAGMYLTGGKPRVIINGIKPEPSAFNDLLDRFYTVSMKRLKVNKEEKNVQKMFNEIIPQLRFACLKEISIALYNEEKEYNNLPRLADFTILCEELSINDGEEKGTFINHYRNKLGNAHGAGLDDPFAAVLMEYIEAHKEIVMSYSALEWYQKIKEWSEEKYTVDENSPYPKWVLMRPELFNIVNDKDFLKTPIAIGRRFRELNQILELYGYEVEYIRTNQKNIIEVKKKK